MTKKSISREECVALAHRVSGGDRAYEDWVRSDPSDDYIGRHFDSHALAKCLAREMVAAECVILASSDRFSGPATFANPYNGRFQSLKKQLESSWLPQVQELRGSECSPELLASPHARGCGKVFEVRDLVEYLENLFVKERGAIRREEIERIGLALVGPHGANKSDMGGKADARHSPKRKPGRPPDKRESVEVAMREDLETGRLTAEDLRGMKGMALTKQYSVHKDTASEARENVLSEIARN